jgi:hypothetical protein
MVLFVGALAFWPWADSRLFKPAVLPPDIAFSLGVAALSVLIRPQIALLWLFVGVAHLIGLKKKSSPIQRVLLYRVLPIGCAAGVCQLLMDRYFYQQWTFSPWNFFAFNILQVGTNTALIARFTNDLAGAWRAVRQP